MNFNIGDIVQTKKPHPCGGNQWRVLRIGMDFRMECLKCNHQVMVTRIKFEKSVKKVISTADKTLDGDAN